MLDFQRIQRQYRRTVQIFVNCRDLVSHHAVVHRRHKVAKRFFRRKAHDHFLRHTAGRGAAHNLVSENVVPARLCQHELEIHPVFGIRVNLRGRRGREHFRRAVRQKPAALMRQPKYAGVVVHIINRPRLLRELPGILFCPLVRRHAPAFKKRQQIPFGRRAGKPHQVLVRITGQHQRDSSRRGRLRRVPRVGVHPGKEQILKLLIIVVVSLVVIAVVIGQVKLPVHPQLREHVGSTSLRAGRHLLIDLVILEPHAIAGISRLCQHGIIIVRDLRHRVGSLVDAVPDFVGDSPAKIPAVHISPVHVRLHRSPGRHAPRLVPLNPDMVAGRIHERPRKHPLITDVQMHGRISVLHRDCIAPVTFILRQSLIIPRPTKGGNLPLIFFHAIFESFFRQFILDETNAPESEEHDIRKSPWELTLNHFLLISLHST